MKSCGRTSSGVSCSRSATAALARATSTRWKNIETLKECRSGFTGRALILVQPQQSVDRFGDAARRNLRCQAAEAGSLLTVATANHDEILRYHPVTELANAALESDGRDVVLTAAIGAAADLDMRV